LGGFRRSGLPASTAALRRVSKQRRHRELLTGWRTPTRYCGRASPAARHPRDSAARVADDCRSAARPARCCVSSHAPRSEDTKPTGPSSRPGRHRCARTTTPCHDLRHTAAAAWLIACSRRRSWRAEGRALAATRRVAKGPRAAAKTTAPRREGLRSGR
jgi:hypothetical protein